MALYIHILLSTVEMPPQSSRKIGKNTVQGHPQYLRKIRVYLSKGADKW